MNKEFFCASCGNRMVPILGGYFHVSLTGDEVAWKCPKCGQKTYQGDTWESLGLEKPSGK